VKPLDPQTRESRLLEQRNVLAPNAVARVMAAKERVVNTRRIIAQSRVLLGKARQTLNSAEQLGLSMRRALKTKA